MKSQKQLILEHLQSGRTLDRLQALELYGVFESPARISELRKDGYDIETTYKKVKTRYCKNVSVAVWRLKEKSIVEKINA